MQHIIVGIGEDGRSKVIEVQQIAFAEGPPTLENHRAVLWKTENLPPELPVPRRHRADVKYFKDVSPGPTSARWSIIRRPPLVEGELHRTDTLDFQRVLAGEVTLVLEDGEILMRAGDSTVIPGLADAWRAGAEGYTLEAVLFGYPIED